MNKLREGSTSSIPLLLSSSTASLAIFSSQTHGVSLIVSFDTHPSSTNNMTKSRSTHNLILSTIVISTFTTQHSKIPSSRRGRGPYYKQLETNKTKQSDPISNDRRMAIINHLVDNLHKRLNKLENLYSKVSQNSYKRDLIMKQSIEQIFICLHMRITNEHQ